jgi:hypothetical protein
VTRRARGVIDSVVIENFEALSNDGRLLVQITNIGNITATFYVGVLNCTNNIDPIGAQQISAKPWESKQLTFAIYTTAEIAQYHECAVYLKNALGELLETKAVNFNTTKRSTTSSQDPASQQTKPEEQTVSEVQLGKSPDCDTMCPQWFNVFCFFVNVRIACSRCRTAANNSSPSF